VEKPGAEYDQCSGHRRYPSEAWFKELTSYETAMNVSKIALRTQAESESRDLEIWSCDNELGQPNIL